MSTSPFCDTGHLLPSRAPINLVFHWTYVASRGSWLSPLKYTDTQGLGGGLRGGLISADHTTSRSISSTYFPPSFSGKASFLEQLGPRLLPGLRGWGRSRVCCLAREVMSQRSVVLGWWFLVLERNEENGRKKKSQGTKPVAWGTQGCRNKTVWLNCTSFFRSLFSLLLTVLLISRSGRRIISALYTSKLSGVNHCQSHTV